MEQEKTIVFPKDFLFGTATSAVQLEGAALTDGKGLNIWDVFAGIPGTIGDGSTPDPACDFYHKYEEDLKLARSLGMQSFRFSFSWARLFPEGKGKPNQKGIDFYKRMLDVMHQNNILPNATLYHWDLPYELEREGGWLNREVVNWFGEYAAFAFREFGKDIPMWATVNEPIATYVGYGMGGFAPGRKGEAFGRCANHHILLAHGEAVQRFREEHICDGKIGIVVDIWNHHPFRPDHPEDCRIAEMENEKTYRSYLNPIFRGCYTDKLLEWMREQNCMPKILDGDMEKIHQPLDYFGLNCYNRVVDCADPALLPEKKSVNLGGNFLDNGNEYYPKAVYDAIHILQEDYQIGIPIYITENGISNCQEEPGEDGRIHDRQRILYMKGFLTWIHKALEEGMDVRGYYAWSLLDNWEWTAGYESRFGLVHTDFKTQERVLKDSALWYQKLVASRKIAQDSPLKGKNLLFLGSSVTYGANANGISFADAIGVRNNCHVIKEAVSGTTLVDESEDSYVSRLKKMDTSKKIDLLICQLSTNDITREKQPGMVSRSQNLEDFNVKTIAGAIEYIIAYAKKIWNCPVVFYTNPRYDSTEYGVMVELLKEIVDKWEITLLDLWNHEEMNSITEEQQTFYMADSIHPTLEGYLQWWTPVFEKCLYSVVQRTDK